jgi:hypothetical protein
VPFFLFYPCSTLQKSLRNPISSPPITQSPYVSCTPDVRFFRPMLVAMAG